LKVQNPDRLSTCYCPSRRTFLATAIGLIAATEAQAASLPKSCKLNASQTSSNSVLSTSGNNRLDSALISELQELLTIIPVKPGFKYIVDPSPNAFALDQSYIPNTRGTVFLGINLIKNEFSVSGNAGIAVAGICAHESAHIFQYFSEYNQRLSGSTSRNFELHADLIAGYYLGRRRWSRTNIEVFGRSLFSKGDYDFNNPDHHGTPKQRLGAMLEGYRLATLAKSFEECAAAGAAYVHQVM
jgi:hypothetical protein